VSDFDAAGHRPASPYRPGAARLTRLSRVCSDNDAGRGAPITGLAHVQLLVSDVGASAKWYSAVLGLVPFADDPDIGYVALRHKAGKFVVVLTQAPAARDKPAEAAHDRLDHLALAVPDRAQLAEWAEHITEIGIHHAGVVLEDGHPSLQLRDPDGVAIELVAP
jgi:glyoxylase I family protein